MFPSERVVLFPWLGLPEVKPIHVEGRFVAPVPEVAWRRRPTHRPAKLSGGDWSPQLAQAEQKWTQGIPIIWLEPKWGIWSRKGGNKARREYGNPCLTPPHRGEREQTYLGERTANNPYTHGSPREPCRREAEPKPTTKETTGALQPPSLSKTLHRPPAEQACESPSSI